MSGNSPEDWRIFEVLCDSGGAGDSTMTAPRWQRDKLDTKCGGAVEHHHGIDLTTTLRSELAAISYKRDRLASELADAKAALSSKDSECETLRAQTARQSALIGSLQGRLQAAENREQSVQTRCDSTIDTIQREKRSTDERNKELQCRVSHLETHLANEESQKDQVRTQLSDLMRRLATAMGMEGCDGMHLSADCVVARAEEVMTEWQRAKAKVAATCDTLGSCENELLNLKSLANIEKQRLSGQLEAASSHNHELESRCRQLERDLQGLRDRLTEADIDGEKMKEELRGFESRCHRLQNAIERTQNERGQYLRLLAGLVGVPEPCETVIKDKVREIMSDVQGLHAQVHKLREQLAAEHEKLTETEHKTECRLRTEEAQKNELEERLEKCHAEINTLRNDHLGLSEYLQRLARALAWSECTSPPTLGADTNMMAESLLERAERLTAHLEHEHHDGHHHQHHHHHHHRLRHDHTPEKGCCDHHHHHNHLHGPMKLRRERSCHDLPLKDVGSGGGSSTSSMYNLQRRVRVLREQVQRRDLHLELLRRKLAIIEDGARGKCVLQGERDDAVCRAKKACKHIDKLTEQLADARHQIAEVKAQLAEAVEYKITALERARKIDELSAQVCDMEEERARLLGQVGTCKERLNAANESSQNRRCRDEALIHSLREDLNRLQAQLSDANHRLSHLQSFRTSVARTLHLRDLPESDLLHRLQALCSAHQEFTLLSKRYETASPPLGDHPCPRFDDPVPTSPSHCRPPSPLTLPSHQHLHHSTGHGHGTGHAATLGGHHRHASNSTHGRHHRHHHHHRSKSRSVEKRLHDECFESDIHRQHCKDDLLLPTGCDDDFNYKSKYC